MNSDESTERDSPGAEQANGDSAAWKEVAEALHASERRYKALFESALDGIFAMEIGEQGPRFIDCNSCAAEMYGCRREDILGRSPADFSPPTQPDGQPSSAKAKKIADAALAGEPQRFEWTHRRGDGTLFEAEVKLNLVEVENLRHLLAIVRDTSERKQVEEERSRLTAILEATSDFVSTSTIDGRLTYINRAGKRMLGWDEEENLIGRQIPDAHPDWAFKIVKYEGIPAAIEQGIWEGETALMGPEGAFSTSQVIMSHRASDGKLAYLSTIIRDISGGKQAEKEISESQQRFRSLSDQAIVGIIIIQGGRHLYVNQAAAKITEYSIEEMLSWEPGELARLIHPDDAAYVMEQARKKQAGEELHYTRYEHRLVTKTGKIKWVEIHSKAIQYGGQIADMVAAIDITDRKQTEEALQESEEKYRILVERANDGIMIVQDGLVKFANNQAAKITGYAVDEMLDTMFLNFVAPDDRPRVMGFHQRRLQGEDVEEIYEFWGLCRDGAKVSLEVNSGVITYQGAAAVLAFIRDISARKQVERELARHRDHLEELVEERTTELSMARRVTEGINEVFKRTLTNQGEEEVAQTCLAVAEQLTGSMFGFIGEINPQGRFDTIALSNPGWEKCRMPKSEAAAAIRDMELHGYWSRPLIDGQSLVVNDPAAHPDQAGVPAGHPLLTSYLGAPCKLAEKTFGLIALANKKQGYDDGDVKAIETLAGAFVEILMRKRAEKAEQTRSAELRRAVSLMSGREERMAELKIVINKLRTQLEEAGIKPAAADPLKQELDDARQSP